MFEKDEAEEGNRVSERASDTGHDAAAPKHPSGILQKSDRVSAASGTKLMFANDLADSVSEPSDRRGSRCHLQVAALVWTRSGLAGDGTELLDRADAEPVRLAQSSVDGTRLRHKHSAL